MGAIRKSSIKHQRQDIVTMTQNGCQKTLQRKNQIAVCHMYPCNSFTCSVLLRFLTRLLPIQGRKSYGLDSKTVSQPKGIRRSPRLPLVGIGNKFGDVIELMDSEDESVRVITVRVMIDFFWTTKSSKLNILCIHYKL
jgi:hypothetical protein